MRISDWSSDVCSSDLFSEEKVAALRLRDGAREACYPVAAVLDIAEMPAVPDMVAMHGLLSGVAVIDGEHLEVINTFALFAALPDEPIAEPSSGRCLLADRSEEHTSELQSLMRISSAGL